MLRVFSETCQVVQLPHACVVKFKWSCTVSMKCLVLCLVWNVTCGQIIDAFQPIYTFYAIVERQRKHQGAVDNCFWNNRSLVVHICGGKNWSYRHSTTGSYGRVVGRQTKYGWITNFLNLLQRYVHRYCRSTNAFQ